MNARILSAVLKVIEPPLVNRSYNFVSFTDLLPKVVNAIPDDLQKLSIDFVICSCVIPFQIMGNNTLVKRIMGNNTIDFVSNC